MGTQGHHYSNMARYLKHISQNEGILLVACLFHKTLAYCSESKILQTGFRSISLE
jgi:hypothetical protein